MKKGEGKKEVCEEGCENELSFKMKSLGKNPFDFVICFLGAVIAETLYIVCIYCMYVYCMYIFFRVLKSSYTIKALLFNLIFIFTRDSLYRLK